MVQIKNPLMVVGTSAGPSPSNIYEEISHAADIGEAQDRYPVGTLIDVSTGEIVTTEVADHLTMRIVGYGGTIVENDVEKYSRPQLQAVRVLDVPRVFNSSVASASDAEWKTSSIRTWLNLEYVAGLPEAFRNSIKTSKITTLNKYSSSSGNGYYKTEDKFYLAAAVEMSSVVSGNSAYYIHEGTAFSYYAGINSNSGNTSRIAYDPSGTARTWWLRTPNLGTGVYVRNIGTNGEVNDVTSSPSYPLYVRPCCNL